MFGLVISAFEPRSPATLPDPDSVMKSCIDTKSEIILCLPTFVEVSCLLIIPTDVDHSTYLFVGLVTEEGIRRIFEVYFWHCKRTPDLNIGSVLLDLHDIKICGGGSLNKLTGDDLWKQGVGIFLLYAWYGFFGSKLFCTSFAHLCAAPKSE